MSVKTEGRAASSNYTIKSSATTGFTIEPSATPDYTIKPSATLSYTIKPSGSPDPWTETEAWRPSSVSIKDLSRPTPDRRKDQVDPSECRTMGLLNAMDIDSVSWNQAVMNLDLNAASRQLEKKIQETRNLEPRTIELRTMEPRTIEPRIMEPRTMEPRTIEPRTMEPRTMELRTMEPGTMEPRTMEPRDLEPRTMEPRTVEPRNLEPRNQLIPEKPPADPDGDLSEAYLLLNQIMVLGDLEGEQQTPPPPEQGWNNNDNPDPFNHLKATPLDQYGHQEMSPGKQSFKSYKKSAIR